MATVLTSAQAVVVARALADAEHYRRDSAAAWCIDCAAVPDGCCPDHVAYLAWAHAYRDMAAELAQTAKVAGRDVSPPRPASDRSRLGQERTLSTNLTTTAPPPAVRPLSEILAAVSMATCGHCWTKPGTPCAHGPDGAGGYHVARLSRAMRRGLITGPELVAVLQALVTFSSSTVVYDVAPAVV
jgi:hypothetical protein